MKCKLAILGERYGETLRDECLKCTCHHTWLYLKGVPKNRHWARNPATTLKQMTVSATFPVYLHDRGAKQSERSLHSHSAPPMLEGVQRGWKKRNAHVRELKDVLKAGRKNARPLFVCLPVNSHEWAHVSVYVVACHSLCVFRGVYLYKDIVGVLDLWGSQFKRREPPPLFFHPLIQVAVGAFSLKLNKRALDNGSRQSGPFVCALNLSSTFLPFTPSFFHLCHFLSPSGPVPVRPTKFLLTPPPPTSRTYAQSLWLNLSPLCWDVWFLPARPLSVCQLLCA